MISLRTIFFGTPQLSADILNYLLGDKTLEIVAVVTNPDEPAGRGHEIITSPVGLLAKEKNIALLQPKSVKNNSEFLEQVKALKPDICIVVAYGKILPQELLDIPSMGFLNVHSSLLPKYRGAAPIQHALLNGEKTTGLTIMQLDLGMDEGDILLQEAWEISPTDTTGALYEKKGKRGGPLLIETIRGLLNKTITPQKQNHSNATYSQKIEKKDGELQLSWTVDEAYHRWQAYTPWPGLYLFMGDTKITLLKVKKYTTSEKVISSKDPFIVIENLPTLKLTDGYLIVEELHPAGKKPMKGEDFVRGYLR